MITKVSLTCKAHYLICFSFLGAPRGDEVTRTTGIAAVGSGGLISAELSSILAGDGENNRFMSILSISPHDIAPFDELPEEFIFEIGSDLDMKDLFLQFCKDIRSFKSL